MQKACQADKKVILFQGMLHWHKQKWAKSPWPLEYQEGRSRLKVAAEWQIFWLKHPGMSRETSYLRPSLSGENI